MLAHHSDEDEAVRHYMAERARVVRRLGDVVADMNAELDLEVVLDRIAASLRELTRADAGGFVLIEGDRLRLVSMDGLPAELRGRTADLPTSLVGELMRSGNTVLMRTGESGRFDDLIWSALPGLHTITLSLSHVAGRPYGALYALYSGRKVGHVDLELLELLAGHASVALSNATAFAEVVRQRAHERAVIDSSADGIAVLDGDGMVRQWNPAAHALTGVSAAQAAGKPPPFPLPEPGATLTCRLPNDRWIDVLCTVLEGRDEQVIDFRDVTAAKALEEAKDLFLATTSHELRTPITVVQGFASTLASRWDKLLDSDRRSAVQTIAERAESLARLVDQLLLGSRAGANRLTVSNEPFDLTRLLTEAAKVFMPLSDRHTLVAAVPDGLPAAHGDAAATDSIVSQLLENAFKYSPDGGTVTIAAAVVPGSSRARGHCHGRGNRDRPGRRRAGLRAFRPGRGGRPEAVRRHRARPLHRAPASEGAGRRGDRGGRAGRRDDHAADASAGHGRHGWRAAKPGDRAGPRQPTAAKDTAKAGRRRRTLPRGRGEGHCHGGHHVRSADGSRGRRKEGRGRQPGVGAARPGKRTRRTPTGAGASRCCPGLVCRGRGSRPKTIRPARTDPPAALPTSRVSPRDTSLKARRVKASAKTSARYETAPALLADSRCLRGLRPGDVPGGRVAVSRRV